MSATPTVSSTTDGAGLNALHSVIDWFYGRGMTVRLPGALKPSPLPAAPEAPDIGSLFVEQRVDVRLMDRPFTGRSDWPLGAKFVVAERHAWESAAPRPYAVMVVSPTMSHVAIVKAATRAYWTVERQPAAHPGEAVRDFYLCPMEHVEFLPLARPSAPK